MTSLTPFVSLPEMLSAPVSKDDLSEELRNEKNEEFLAAFEDAWVHFLSGQEPDGLPRGPRVKRIEAMQREIQEIRFSKDTVEIELKKQLDFFQGSRQKLEKYYDEKMRASTKKQRAIHQELTLQLENADKAERLQKQTLPWFNFLEEINNLSIDEERFRMSTSESSAFSIADSEDQEAPSRAPKPSGRAMFLLNLNEEEVQSGDASLRGYEVDHAILTAHAQMLKKEIDRVEYLSLSQEFAGKFLAEYNALDLLSEDQPKIPEEVASVYTDITEATMGTLKTNTSADDQ